MTDTLRLSDLPTWKHAGMHPEDVPHTVIKPATARDYARVVIGRVGTNEHDAPWDNGAIYDVVPIEEKIVDRNAHLAYLVHHNYLVPHHERVALEEDITRRDIALLSNRLDKFFSSAPRGLNVFRTRQQLHEQIVRFSHHFETFSFDQSFRDHNPTERELILCASQSVGQAVNRLGALGKVLIQGNRHNVTIEYDDAYIAEHMKEIGQEFFSLWHFLTASTEGMRMCDCVMTRDGLKDRDRVSSQLIREMLKPVNGHMRAMDITWLEKIEGAVDHGIVHDIAATMRGIDEIHASMNIMLEHPFFGTFVRSANQAIANGSFVPNVPKDIDLTAYRGMVREFVELSRARTGIPSSDAQNYEPLDTRLRMLRHDIDFCHQAMMEFTQFREHLILSPADKIRNKVAQLTLPLLERGITLMADTFELRLPRNSKSSGIDGRESSIEHYAAKVNQLLDGTINARHIDD